MSQNNNLYIFYHIPKSGGTFFRDHAMLYAMDRNNPNRQIYDLCSTKINVGCNHFFVANFYTLKHDTSKYHEQTIDYEIFKNCCDSNVFQLYSISIVSVSRFKDTQKLIDKITTKYNFDPIYITLLRNPITRLQSIFYYNTEFGEWEKNHQTISQNTFHEYIHSKDLEKNWVIDHINQRDISTDPTEKDLQQAINTLKDFHIVGILENIEQFELDIWKYGIKYRPLNAPFYDKYPIEKAMNKNTKSIKEHITPDDMSYLLSQCKYDMALYNYFSQKN